MFFLIFIIIIWCCPSELLVMFIHQEDQRPPLWADLMNQINPKSVYSNMWFMFLCLCLQSFGPVGVDQEDAKVGKGDNFTDLHSSGANFFC